MEDAFFNDNVRKLTFDTNLKDIKVIKLKPSDIRSYIMLGAADIGFIGYDEILENSSEIIVLLKKTKIGKCRISIASNKKKIKTVNDFFNSKSTFFTESNFKESDAKELFQKERFEVIPVIKKNGEILKILEWTDYFGPKQRDNDLKGVPVVIMAGGKGTRLKPFTQILPKPLIPINNKTVLERIIEPFHFSGANNFLLTVNYKARILKAFFDELKPRLKVNLIFENKPLGTCGVIKKIKFR